MSKSIYEILASIKDTFVALITKSASKKFLVWVIATHMTYMGILESENWLFISLLYLPLETALDWKALPLAALNKTKQGSNNDIQD